MVIELTKDPPGYEEFDSVRIGSTGHLARFEGFDRLTVSRSNEQEDEENGNGGAVVDKFDKR